MVYYRLLLSIAALLELVGNGVNAAPVETCEEQAPCLGIEVTQDASVQCGLTGGGGCTFTACMTLNTANADCIKGGGAEISHLCDQSGSDGCPNDMGWDVVEQTSGNADTAQNTQCQIGMPGKTLDFLYKDGSGCGGGGLLTLGGGGEASCAPSTSEDVPTCTGNGAGKECIWTVTLPAECDNVAPPPTPSESMCETAYGCAAVDGDACTSPKLIEIDGVNANRWGWYAEGTLSEASTEATYTFEMYAGAAQNDLTKGEYAGVVEVTVRSDGAPTHVVELEEGFSLSEFHLHVGNDYPKTKKGINTVAPGLYTEADRLALDKLYYIIVHAVVCY